MVALGSDGWLVFRFCSHSSKKLEPPVDDEADGLAPTLCGIGPTGDDAETNCCVEGD